MLDKLPLSIEIDEEGEIKELFAFDEGNQYVRFVAKDYDYEEPYHEEPGYPKIYIDVVIKKEKLLTEFCKKLRSFLANDFEPGRWRPFNLKEYLPGLDKTFQKYLH